METIDSGKIVQETAAWIEGVVAPSLEALEKAVQSKNIIGTRAADAREIAFVLDASSDEEVAEFLRSIPFGNALKWTVIPPESRGSVVEQSKAVIRRARAMLRRTSASA